MPAEDAKPAGWTNQPTEILTKVDTANLELEGARCTVDDLDFAQYEVEKKNNREKEGCAEALQAVKRHATKTERPN